MPLPQSDQQEISVTFSYRLSTNALGALLEKESEKVVSPPEHNNTVPQKSEKAPLPDTADKVERVGRRMNLQAKRAPADSKKDKLAFLSDEERSRLLQTALALQASPKGKRLHPILQQHKAAFRAWEKQHPRDPYADWKRDSYGRRTNDGPPLWERVSEEVLPRVYGILDPLFRAVERLGGQVRQDLTMTIRGEQVSIGIQEGRDKTAHVLTKSEQKELEQYEREKLRYSYTREPKFRKYDYIPNGKLRISAYGESFFRDTDTAGVEERIGEILLALYMESERVRIEREKWEEAQRKAEEEKRQRELRRQRYNDEVDHLDALLNEASDFQIACRIRAYVASVAAKSDLNDAEKEWVEWATAKADWYDPTVSAVDPVFGKRDHGENAEKKRPTKKGRYYW